METESRERSLKRMSSFEIECCSRALSRENDISASETFWDDEKLPAVRWNPLRRTVQELSSINKEKATYNQFLNDLSEARLDDVGDLEMLDFVRLGAQDEQGRETLIFIAKHIPNEIIQLERTQRFILRKIENVGRRNFNVLYIHTGSTLWTSHLGLRVTWSLFNRIPRLYRDRLHQFYILHPDIYVQLTMWFVVRWFMYQLWEKIHYLSRIEDMEAFFTEGAIEFPSFVEAHDEELNKNPLMDYGFCTINEMETSSSHSGPVFYT